MPMPFDAGRLLFSSFELAYSVHSCLVIALHGAHATGVSSLSNVSNSKLTARIILGRKGRKLALCSISEPFLIYFISRTIYQNLSARY